MDCRDVWNGLSVWYRCEDLGSGSFYHKIKGRTNLQKGGHAGLLEKHGEWLGSSTGPHTKESVDGKDRPVVQQGVGLLWVK